MSRHCGDPWRRWTDVEDARLAEIAPTHTAPEAARVMDRTENSVCSRARQLGVHFKPRCSPSRAGSFPKNRAMFNDDSPFAFEERWADRDHRRGSVTPAIATVYGRRVVDAKRLMAGR